MYVLQPTRRRSQRGRRGPFPPHL